MFINEIVDLILFVSLLGGAFSTVGGWQSGYIMK